MSRGARQSGQQWHAGETIEGITVHHKAEHMPSLPDGPFVRLDNGNILSVAGRPARAYLSEDEGATWSESPLFPAGSPMSSAPTGALLKTAHYEDYRDGALGLRAMRIVVRNHVRPGEMTTMTFSDLRELDVSAFPFDPETLPLFRDAAQAFLEAEGVQVRAEDLPGLLGAGGP